MSPVSTTAHTSASPADSAAGSGITAVLPEGYEHLRSSPELTAAWTDEVLIRRAQARQLQSLAEYRERRAAEESARHVFGREAVLKAVNREIGLLLGIPESQVARMLTTTETTREWLPRTWQAYQDGLINADRMQHAAEGAADLIETNSGAPQVQRSLTAGLDRAISTPEPGENRNTVARKVRDTVASLDPAGHQRRYQLAQQKRHVSFREQGEGMTLMKALLPTLVLAPIEERLHAAAATAPRQQSASGKKSSAAGYHQRMADILSDWLSTGSSTATGQSKGAAGINITIPLDTLTGASQTPAHSSDRRLLLPAEQARSIASDPRVQKNVYLTGTRTTPGGETRPERIVKLGAASPLINQIETAGQNLPGKPAAVQEFRERLVQKLTEGKNLLDSVSKARFVTGNLRTAVLLRDGHCQAPGCLEPGFRSDLDHTTSHETGGSTSAENAQVLCHTHHEIKSHRLLPQIPAGRDSPEPEHPPDPDPPDRPPEWALRESD